MSEPEGTKTAETIRESPRVEWALTNLEGGESILDIGCFPPNTYVLTNGLTPIQDIIDGDVVVTANGLKRKVLRTLKRNYSGELVVVHPEGFLPISMTIEHPVLRIRGPKGNTISHEDRVSHLMYSTRDFVCASELNEGDYVVCPRITGQYVPYGHLDISTYLGKIEIVENRIFSTQRSNLVPDITHKTRCNPIPRIVKLTESLMSLLGFYIAEGSLAGGLGIEFTFGPSEMEYAKHVSDSISSNFGLHSTIDQIPTGFRTRCHSRLLSRLFETWFGNGSHEKKIPDWVFLTPSHMIAKLVVSAWKGDGHKTERRNRVEWHYYTASERLARGLWHLLLKMGVPSRLKQIRHKTAGYGPTVGFRLSIDKKEDSENFASWYYEVDYYNKDQTTLRGVFIIDQTAYMRIKRIERVPYDGPVFNLEVEEYNSYIANGIVVHNCNDGWFLKRCEHPEKAGVDSDKVLVQTCKDIGIDAHVGYSWKLPFDNDRFDRVHFGQTIAHMKEDLGVRSIFEMRRVLKPKGLALISTVIGRHFAAGVYFAKTKRLISLTEPWFHVKEYEPQELVEIIASLGLKMVKHTIMHQEHPDSPTFKEFRFVQCYLVTKMTSSK